MMRRISWGTWIVISFILFAAGTFTMIAISMNTKVDLVTEDYYEKELRYQEHIDLVNSTTALDRPVTVELSGSVIRIVYPRIGERTLYGGTVHFFRPSDKAGDLELPVAIDTSFAQSFPRSMFAPGLWRVKISWKVGEKGFYSEQPVMVP